MESSANKLSKFLYSKGLTVSPSKSSLVIFTKKYINPFAYSINVDDSIIQSTDSCKFLGIHFDYRLTGKNHINSLSIRCSKLLNILSMLRGTWWGGDPRSLLHIYKALIRSSIEYGCLTFPFNTHTEMYKLEKIQFRAIRLCLGLRKTTPSKHKVTVI